MRRGDDLFSAFHRQMDRLFDEFFRDFSLAPFRGVDESWGAYVPSIDVKENEKEFQISAELPGMDDKDVEVSITGDVLTIKGEKKLEKEEEEDKGYYRRERAYGSFQRRIQLPAEVDTDKVSAHFKKGVLTVTLPKTEEAQKAVRKIEVKAE